LIDRDIHLAKALLVESNALLRSVAAGQLRDLGIGQVSNASRVKDARLLLERERFDIVICNRDFEGSDYSGQDLLDELRRENLLPHSTVFLMVVQTATYHQVMEAGRSGTRWLAGPPLHRGRPERAPARGAQPQARTR
jgi:CheY-like chemotaxis protein